MTHLNQEDAAERLGLAPADIARLVEREQLANAVCGPDGRWHVPLASLVRFEERALAGREDADLEA